MPRTRPLDLFLRSLAALVLAACSSAPHAPSVLSSADAPPAATRMAGDIVRLTAPDFEGRGAGTPGADAASTWVAERFRALGLEPAGDDGYFQSFTIPAARTFGDAVTVEIVQGDKRTPISGSEFEATLASAPGQAEGWLVDVGNGSRFDDAAWGSSEPKIALATMDAPAAEAASASAPANPHGGSSLRGLAFTVRQHGAVGLILLASDPSSMERADGEGHDVGLPVLIATPRAAEGLIAHVADLARAARDAGSPLAAPALKLHFDSGVAGVERRTRNVLGKLPGARADSEIVVLGAHYDHLGLGGSDSLAPGVKAMHPGADDNASGTALLLEIARRFASRAQHLERGLVFAAWGAEEKGLLGSAYWTKHPTVPWDRVVANLNFDMVGRSKDRHVDIGGVGSSPVFEFAIEAANKTLPSPLVVRTSVKARGIGGSDHMSFLAAGRPALFFFTGLHPDYHKPSDTAEKIEAGTMADLVELSVRLVEGLDRQSHIEFVKPPEPPADSSPASPGAEQSLRATLGTIPDYGAEEGGVVLAGVGPGSAAEKAGLRAKDVIVKIGPYKIGDIYDMTEALSRLKPGDEVEVQYTRDGASQTAKATLGRRR